MPRSLTSTPEMHAAKDDRLLFVRTSQDLRYSKIFKASHKGRALQEMRSAVAIDQLQSLLCLAAYAVLLFQMLITPGQECLASEAAPRSPSALNIDRKKTLISNLLQTVECPPRYAHAALMNVQRFCIYSSQICNPKPLNPARGLGFRV